MTINDLRKEGYLDWQIILATLNFILDYKIHLRIDIENHKFKNEEEHVNLIQKYMSEFLRLDEKEFPVQFPIEAFNSDKFRMHLDMFPAFVLESINLENKSRFPNFKAIKEFLNIRFNMLSDNTDEGNPIQDIILKKDDDVKN